MIGKYIKKIWENWPSEKTKIMAEDLNKYEDTLAEHDARLNELKGIENKVTETESNIKKLQNMSSASEYANNSVILTDEEKVCGSIFGDHVCKKTYRIYRHSEPADGTIVIDDAIVNDSLHQRMLLNIEVAVRTNGHSGRQYSGNGFGDATINHYYDPITHAVIINYTGMGTGPKEIFVTVTYTRQTA